MPSANFIEIESDPKLHAEEHIALAHSAMARLLPVFIDPGAPKISMA
jgi:hypothetical protein